MAAVGTGSITLFDVYDGVAGKGTRVVFSDNGTSGWTTTATATSQYMKSQQTTDNVNWTDVSVAVKIKGETGASIKGDTGDPGIAAVLTNDTTTFPCDSSGNILSLTGNSTTLKIFRGGVDDTASWTYSVHDHAGISPTPMITGTSTVTVEGMTTATAGFVTIRATRAGYDDVFRTFTVSKVLGGKAAESFEIKASVDIIRYVSSPVTYTPNLLQFKAYKYSGDTATDHLCKIVIYGSTDGTTWTELSSNSTQASSHSLSITTATYKMYKGVMLSWGTMTPELDSQTVPLLQDGAMGPSGKASVRAYAATLTFATPPNPSKPTNNVISLPTPGSPEANVWYNGMFALDGVNIKYLWQSDGVYDPQTNSTQWFDPYLSLFKVDTLEAFSTKTGSLSSGANSYRLTINDRVKSDGVTAIPNGETSHEFRCWSSIGLMASMGSTNTSGGAGEALFNAKIQNMPNLTNTNFASVGYNVNIRDNTQYVYGTGCTDVMFAGGTINTAGVVTTKATVLLGHLAKNDPQGSIGAYIQMGNQVVGMCDGTWAMATLGGVLVDGSISVTGDITANGDIIGYSDRRLKNDIKPLDRDFFNIRGYSFSWNNVIDKAPGKSSADVGVIADEVKRVIPEAVSADDNGYEMVAYQKLIPALFEMVHQLNERLMVIEGRQHGIE